MTKRKANEKDDLMDEYNNRRRWIGNDFADNESLKKAFPRYADRSWSASDVKKKIRDLKYFGKMP
jgi:hypothetical protein